MRARDAGRALRATLAESGSALRVTIPRARDHERLAEAAARSEAAQIHHLLPTSLSVGDSGTRGSPRVAYPAGVAPGYDIDQAPARFP